MAFRVSIPGEAPMAVARASAGDDAIVSPRGAGWRPPVQSTQSHASLELGMIRLPGRMRRALRLFRNITGLTAVTGLAAPLAGSDQPSAFAPPVHPRCAKRLRSGRAAPCREQWFMHLRSGRRSPGVHSHTCPIGLRCSCVPVRLDGHLIGVAKLVVGAEASDRAFSTATAVLKLVVDGVCQDSLVAGLSEEVGALRLCVADIRRIQSNGDLVADNARPPARAPDSRARPGRNLALVDKALSHLHRHYQEPALSLRAVAKALACNPRYLTTRFTLIVGEHMHAYLIRLRLARACRLLMDTGMPIKEAAYGSGLRGNAALARAFRRHVGVSPGEYRRIFAAR